MDNKDNKNKTYDRAALQIYCFNNEYYVIAVSIEEAVSLFKEYLEKETDDVYRGHKIKNVTLVSSDTISKKPTIANPMNEL